MSKKKDNFYITTPIYYVNDKPHIGHFYSTLAADVAARYHRLIGKKVHFLTGTDEHGQKVQRSAEAAGQSPLDFATYNSNLFRGLFSDFGISFDDFIRTTNQRHIQGVLNLWQKLWDKGYIYLDTYAGWYAVRDEAFYKEEELTLNAEGKKIAPSGAEVAWVEEKSYFFKLSTFTDQLLDYYEKNPEFIRPEGRKNEVIQFVKSGLKDLSISRTTFDWGVKVPEDTKHVIYVWLDALTNYISALGYGGDEQNMAFWPADFHVVGKDILRFHAVYWPAFLMAADLALPSCVYAHGWWTNEGQKISKSLGNAIDPRAMISKFGLDPLRYYLLRDVPFGQDGDFSESRLVARLNGDLGNAFGNLVQRVLSFIHKNTQGTVYKPKTETREDQLMLQSVTDLWEVLDQELSDLAFHRALGHIFDVILSANAYVDQQAPWKLKKENQDERMQAVLYVLVATIHQLALLLHSFMPDTMDKCLAMLSADIKILNVLDSYTVTEPQVLFPKFDPAGL